MKATTLFVACGILLLSGAALAQTALGTNFSYGSVTSPAWASNWQSSFAYTSIDGVFSTNMGWLGVGFNGLPISNQNLPTGDAILQGISRATPATPTPTTSR